MSDNMFYVSLNRFGIILYNNFINKRYGFNNNICPKCGIKFAIYDVRESTTTVNDPDDRFHYKISY